MSRRASDFGLRPGILRPGPRNMITDVPGVKVGQVTLQGNGLNTGVTAIVPAPGNLFTEKLVAGVSVINGFGKSAGLMQLAELGTLETPVVLTNTFGVGTCVNALIRRAICETPEIGRTTSTVNPVVGECNDGALSDIQAMAVTEAHVLDALDQASDFVAEGSVGAGTGMSCFGFKGGVGTASRQIEVEGQVCHLGALVVANFGRAGDLVLPDGRVADPKRLPEAEKGSIMVVLATDVPLDSRQVTRVCHRGGAGIARLGAFWGNGSGDIVLGFTTANRIAHSPDADCAPLRRLGDHRIDDLFRAATESTQDAILNALCMATAVDGRDGATRPLLSDWLARAGG
ncbi:P1 family peptidase [Salipiger bermudensis]|uniref:DmpA family aminopeptidase n=1 Tax=Salipiger bermudensis TaxID=344736 RepID=UPI001CD1BE5F|nr:P1 family peptidase [Salipiger bermudensis]MCA0964091.1 P1 family peptidase [Salipiger bermudensis]